MAFDFPSNPTTGTVVTGPNGVQWVWDGAKWTVVSGTSPGLAPINSPVFTGDPQAPSPPPDDADQSIPNTAWVRGLVATAPKVQRFTASGTYTPSVGLMYCVVECVGGGGAGGGGSSGGATNIQQSAGGGGGGAYARKTLTAAQIGASQPVTVGAGGTGVAANNGNPGGASYLGPSGTPLVSAAGGQGGGSNPAGAAGGSGGQTTNSIGDIVAGGGTGQGGLWQASTAQGNLPSVSGGGNSIWGGGGPAYLLSGTSTGAGNSGQLYGGGGTGGYLNGVAVNFAGASGAPGIVVVTEYCSQ